MAVTDQQKLDFLLKKIGYTKTKTGSVVGTGAISGTPKQPFAEAIPSPLVVPNASLWNEADSIPATAPGSDTTQVKVYLAATSGLRMTADSTSSGQRAYIAYTTYNNTSSARLTNWIDTQFGASYLIKVYKGDPNSGGVALSAAGSGANDGWFFDYSAGVLNFNDTSVPSGVTDTNIYIVGYRYVGQTGAPTSGISTFSYLDLTVERNLDVGVQGGISTFRNNIDLNADLDVDGHTNLDNLNVAGVTTFAGATTHSGGATVNTHLDVIGLTTLDDVNVSSGATFAGVVDINAGGQANTFKVEDLTDNRIVIAGAGGELEDSANLTFNGTTLGVTGNATFSGNVSIGGTLTYEDVINVDSVGIITARAGINVTGGVITALAGENKIPSLYANMAALPAAGSYHGMFAHVHSTGRGYFAHAGNWLELVNADLTGRVGTGTESYFIDRLVSTSTTATSLNVTGVTTAVTVDINGDLDVDGHTNLDNVNIVGVTTVNGEIRFPDFSSPNNRISFGDGQDLKIWHSGNSGHLNNLTGDLYIQGAPGNNYVYIAPAGGGAGLARFDMNGSGVRFYSGGITKLLTRADGVRTYGTLEAANLNVTGVTTAITVDVNGDLDVDGHTNLDNVSIAGVTTTAGLLDINAGGQANTFKVEDLTSGRVVLAGTGGELEDNNNLRFDGTDLYVSGIRVGGGGGGIIGDDIITRNLKVNGISTHVGASIFTGNIDANGDLDVDGHTNLDNVSIAGVTTFASTAEFDGTAKFDSTITAGGATGTNGQYLKTTGSGVAWATFPALRTRDTQTASAGQTSFPFNYTVGFLDVFVNGVKLTDSEFTATNGTHVVLAVGSFVGDIVELVSYNTVSAGGGASGIGNVVEDTTPQLGGNLDLFGKTINGTGGISMTGVVTATTFIGDGSGLTGIVASGAGGVVIRDSGSTVGTAGTIDFGDNLSVSPINAGIVTITSGVTTSQFNVNKLDVSGISTFNGNIDVNADLDVDGHTNLDNVSVGGIATVGLNLALSSIGDSDINHKSSSNALRLRHNSQTKLAITASSSTFATNIIGQGNLDVDGQTDLDVLNVAELATFSANIDANGDLDVDGHTNLDNVSIAGVVTATTFKGAVQATSGTFSSGVDITGDLDVDGHTDLDNVSVAGVSTFNNDVVIGSGATVGIGSTVFFGDDVKAVFGSDLDAEIFHDASAGINDFRIIDKVGNLKLETSSDKNVIIKTGSTQKTNLKAVATQGVELNFDGTKRFETTTKGIQVGTGVTVETTGSATYTGIVTALKFVGDGSSLTNVSSSGISTTNVRSDTLVVGENTTGVSTFHRVNIPTDKTLFFGDNLNASISYQSSQNYLYMYGGIGGDMVIQTGGNRNIKLEASGRFEAYTASNKIAIKASTNGVELYQGTSPALRFATTGVGVTVIGITSMTDNLLVGSAATITPAGAAQFAGIVTANSFVGDGSGLTGITASGTGVVIKEGGSTVGTAGTINFVGVDVSPASAGIVTVSTATTSITDGNSKLFVNNVSSSNGNGSFEVFLNEFTSSGTAEALNMHQPSDGYARIDLFHGSTPQTIEVNAKTVYSGYARHRLKFETNNASYGGQLDFLPSVGQWNFYSTYQGTQKNVMSFNYSSVGVGNYMYPITNNAFDLGSSSYKWRQFHTTGVNAGVITATTYHGDGSNLTGISGAQNIFQTIAVSGQSNVVADSTTDTLTLVAGSNMTITTNAGSDTITFASSGGGSGVTVQDEGSALSTTATTLNFVGDNVVATGSGATKTITMTPADTDVQVTWDVVNNSASSYSFTGPGNDGSETNPDIYLVRGQRYRFAVSVSGHPFFIKTAAVTGTGSQYTDGVTGNGSQTGNIDFNVQHDAPSHLYYICQYHGGMVGNIYIIGNTGRGTTSAATGSIANNASANITIDAAKTYALLKIQTSAAAWVTLYTDSTSRSNDSSRNETTDPTPGSGVIAEVITTGSATQIMTPGLIGWNNDGTVSSNVYAKVVNKSGSTGAITVTLTYVSIEY